MQQDILILTKNYPPQIGGIEQYCYSICSSLEKSGTRFYLMKTWPRLAFLHYIHPFLGKILLLNFWRLFWLFCKSLIFGFIYARRVDVIWGMDGSLGFVVYFLSKISGKKSRLSVHNTDIIWNNFFYQKIMPFFWKRMDEIYSVGPYSTEEILKRGVPSKIVFSKPLSSEDLDLIRLNKYEMLAQSKVFNIPNDKIILFSIGRFVPVKGFDWFLENVFRFLDKKKFHYLLTGDGPCLSTYKKIVQSYNITNITFTGSISDKKQKAFLFQNSDYLIFPSFREGNPIVLMEAKFYSLPAVIYPFETSEYFFTGNHVLTDSPRDWTIFLNSTIKHS